MAKIEKYSDKEPINGEDKWIGTDVENNNKTKNFTAKKVAAYLNKSSSIESISLRYIYQDVLPGEDRLHGTISFDTPQGPRVLFSSISTLKFSGLVNGIVVEDLYSEPFKDSFLLFSKASDPSQWAIYSWGTAVEDIDEPGFFDIPLTLKDSSGGLDSTEGYLITLLDYKANLTDTGIPEPIVDGIYGRKKDGQNYSWAEVVSKYIPDIPPATTTTQGYGDIAVGTTASSLISAEYTGNEMFDLMLFKTIDPTKVNESASFSARPSTHYAKIGATEDINLTLDLNQGIITDGDGATTHDLVGSATIYNFIDELAVVHAQVAPNNSWSNIGYVIKIGTQQWEGVVFHSAQLDPYYTNKGVISTIFDADRVANSDINTAPNTFSGTITGVYPFFSTTVTLATLTEQTLQSMATAAVTSMIAENGTDKQSVEFPFNWAVINILEQFNTLSQQWDVISIATFTITSIQKTIEGNVVNYNKYTHNGGTIGARQLRWR